MYSEFIRVVKYDENVIWIFTKLKNPIKGNLQIVFGKSDREES